MDFFTREKTPQNNFSSQNFSVENNYLPIDYRALVSTGATGAAAPEFFEGNKAKKKIFMELEKIYISKKILHQYFQNPNEGPD